MGDSMVIITDQSVSYFERNGECSFCRDRLNEPYLQWESTPVGKDAPASNVISICKKCCLRCGKGLRADLIQIEAIAEIERLVPGYTLTRRTREEIRRKAERAKREDAELMRQMKISSLRQLKQNETDDMTGAPGIRSDED
jgi:hypothetical protein